MVYNICKCTWLCYKEVQAVHMALWSIGEMPRPAVLLYIIIYAEQLHSVIAAAADAAAVFARLIVSWKSQRRRPFIYIYFNFFFSLPLPPPTDRAFRYISAHHYRPYETNYGRGTLKYKIYIDVCMCVYLETPWLISVRRGWRKRYNGRRRSNALMTSAVQVLTGSRSYPSIYIYIPI